MDVKYEELVRNPEGVLERVCDFLGETYSREMLQFHTMTIAQRRGTTRDHAPLGKPVSTEYIGRYKYELSLRDQRIFAAVAGQELAESGYEVEVEPWPLSEADIALYKELDDRTRAAVLEAPGGHLVYESYNDWLVDQREARRQAGIWTTPAEHFPIGHPLEEEIQGFRAPRKWKDHFGIQRRYVSHSVTL
jgi:hypothetical protein